MSLNGHRSCVATAAVILASLLAGCGGSSARTVRGTALGHALAMIGDDPSVRAYFEFGDVAAERSFAGVPATYGAGHPASRWSQILGFGADYFREDPSGKRDGLDIMTGATAISIGQPPHTGGLITGPLVNGAGVRAAVEKLGAGRGVVAGRAGLVWGKEGQTHPDATDQSGVGAGQGEFDRAVITAHTVVAARYESEVATLIGRGGRSAAVDPVLAAISSCLGDVVAADAFDTATAKPRPVRALAEVAAGVRRPANPGSPAQEVLCVVPDGTARTTGAAICARIGPHGSSLPGASGESPGDLDVSARPSGGEVDGRRWSACTVTDRASRPAGWLLSEIEQPNILALTGLT